MYILEVEGRVLDQFLQRVDPADAETMRRCAPIRRDQFDNFIFQATQWAMDDGAPDSFSFACMSFRSAHRSNPAAITAPVPRIPPGVAEHVGNIVSRWERGNHVVGAIPLPDSEARLRDELYLRLGGDLDDGPKAAGRRLCSRMLSARIDDGFVHPAVGGHIWGGSNGVQYPGGPLLEAVGTVGDLARRWEDEPDNRPHIDREITDLAHSLGWNWQTNLR